MGVEWLFEFADRRISMSGVVDAGALQDFFCEAAAHSWAGGGRKYTIHELPGSRFLRYQRDNLLYTDVYWVNGEFSGGKTVIEVMNNKGVWVVAWMMGYEGWCKGDNSQVLAFLKQALLSCYRHSVFSGGRGACEYCNDEYPELIYKNALSAELYSFDRFEGREQILHWYKPGQTDELFWHTYRGLLFAPSP